MISIGQEYKERYEDAERKLAALREELEGRGKRWVWEGVEGSTIKRTYFEISDADLQDIINVNDFGATGDGISNNYEALTACIRHSQEMALAVAEKDEKQAFAEMFYQKQLLAETRMKNAEKRLADAERRNAELLDLLRDIKDAPGGSSFRKHIEAALNPNPGAASHDQ